MANVLVKIFLWFLGLGIIVLPWTLVLNLQILGGSTFEIIFSLFVLLCFLFGAFMNRMNFSSTQFFFLVVIILNSLRVFNPKLFYNPFSLSIENGQSLVPAVFFISLIIVSSLIHLFQNKKLLLFFCLNLLTVSMIYFFQQFSSLNYKYLPFFVSFGVFLKQLQMDFLFGSGIGLFEQAFRLYKPLSFNHLSVWNLSFSHTVNFFWEFGTQLGFLGIAAVFLMFISSAARSIKDRNYLLLFFTVSVFILAFILPYNPVLLLFVFVLCGHVNSAGQEKKHFMKKMFLVFLFLAVCFSLFILARYSLAQFFFQKTTSMTNPEKIYRGHIKTIKFFPQNDAFHRYLSSDSLAIANAIYFETSVSATQKKLAGTLVSQAINEAKAAVSLGKNNSLNWENAGLIYKNLIGIIPEAQNFSLSYFQKAANLDPVNPNLQTQIGTVYFLANDMENSSRFYQNALKLKNNFAPAYFGLALVFKETGQVREAMKNLSLAIDNTPVGTTDFIKMKNLLQDLSEIQY